MNPVLQRCAYCKNIPLPRFSILTLAFSIHELQSAGMLPDNPYELIFSGQYPPLYDKDRHFIPEDWYKSHIDSYSDKGNPAADAFKIPPTQALRLIRISRFLSRFSGYRLQLVHFLRLSHILRFQNFVERFLR